MTTHDDPTERLARQLASAQKNITQIESPSAELAPADLQAAFDVQHRTLAWLDQPVAGWKVGAKSVDGPIQGAPLPADRVRPSGTTLRRADCPVLGLELEIAFRFGRVFDPFSGPYSDEAVLAALSSTLATIEIVSSRYRAWPAVDKLAQLADLQNHGALICGDAVPYDRDFPFVSPAMSFRFNGIDIVKGRIANPCGDPRRLLGWMVNHGVARGLAVGGDVVVTAGTYTGVHFPEAAGTALGEIAGWPPVKLTLV
ncbi:MAG TPA: 2-keto-4-pentenoate hydratase [Burkholderiaceae bacterium]|jgi:2-keto-4-pentenoate hydratase